MSDFEVTGGFAIQCCGRNMMTMEQIRNLVVQFLSWFWPPLLTIHVTTTAPAPALAALPPSPRAPSDDTEDGTDTGTNTSVSVREVREIGAVNVAGSSVPNNASGSGAGSDTETGSSSTYGSEASPNDWFFARAVKREEDSD